MKKVLLTALVFMFGVLLAHKAVADGGYYPIVDSGDIYSGDQRAIIIQIGNTVSVTFSTAYTGDGLDFVWLIPVPTQVDPDVVREIKAQGDAEFLSLDQTSAPEFDYIYPSYDSGSSGCGCGPAATYRSGGGAAEGGAQYGVTVIGTINTEDYEGVILSGASAAGITDWLTDNGYMVSDSAATILDYYVSVDCSFVVLKIKPAQARRYEKEFLPAINIVYQATQLQFPLRISASSTDREVHITAFVIADKTMSSSNFKTSLLNYQDSVSGNGFDRNKFLYNSIKATLADQKGVVVMYANQFVADRQTQDLIPAPFKTTQKYYLTRLETYVFPEMMDQDIFIDPDEQNRPFSVNVVVNFAMSDERRLAYLLPFSVFAAGILRRKKGNLNKYAMAAMILLILIG